MYVDRKPGSPTVRTWRAHPCWPECGALDEPRVSIGAPIAAEPFVGDLDEAALYVGQLALERILAHHDEANPGDTWIDPDGEPIEEDTDPDPLPEPASTTGGAFLGYSGTMSALSGYNRFAPVNYAIHHVGTYHDQKGKLFDHTGWNGDYRTFGNDCTNFVLQALREGGGWEFVSPGFYRSYHYWWYNFINQTWTWVNANSLLKFIPHASRGTAMPSVWDVGVGDLLFVDAIWWAIRIHDQY